MANIYVSSTNDPYQNIASEYTIFKECEEPSLFLWINRPCVIAGKNQNAFAEWDYEYIQRHNILPVRRLTGGGCVYHDLGNLNFTFIDKVNIPNEKYLDIIIQSLHHLGIMAQRNGRNDICIQDKKIGGTAYLIEDHRCLIHGTLMVDVNLEILSKVLTPNVKKYEERGIASVKSRVMNIPMITIEILQQTIIHTFKEMYPNAHIKEVPINTELSNQLASRKWIYGDFSNGEMEIHFKTKKGVITILANTKEGMIQQIKVYSDSLDVSINDQLEKYLLNKPFDKMNYFVNQFIENV